MKVRESITAVSWGLAMVLACLSTNAAAESEKEKRLVRLVDQAVQVVNTEGEGAFNRFGKKGSMWIEGDTYIFVNDAEGYSLFNGGNRSLEGQNLLDIKDNNGKPFIQVFIETVKTKGSGWVDYTWPKPGETQHSNKMSYVKGAKIGDKTVVVGAGYYPE